MQLPKPGHHSWNTHTYSNCLTVTVIYRRIKPCDMKIPDYQSQYPITPFRQAAPRQIPHPAPHHHPATTATAAIPAIRCRYGRRAVRRRSRLGHLRLMRSHFAMSSISPKFISLIIKDIRFDNLLDPAYFATKRPFCPISSQVQQMSFSRAPDYQIFL